ncbi:ankyrin repeat-containing domain protein [Echria macrotheca]|uniref:Ankyrin repeat-containing domain protein n=1 Tax=Echria macrotheca TaxID=438768 RepID=A0AAJ0B790_9PEZI|nr:ankyrin repeat-containing domain protein [Echria macrotheca]
MAGTRRRWFHRRPKTTPAPPSEPSPAARYFVAPPAVEALPSYATATEEAASLSPSQPPAFSAEPPPDYQAAPDASPVASPPSSPELSRQISKSQFTLSEQRKHLEAIFARYPWRRVWGSQPTTFADALNKGALLGNQQLLTALFDLGVEVCGNVNHAIQSTTPVHEALRGPKPWFALSFIGRLLDLGGEARELLDSKNAVGCTPLHLAAEAGETAIARTFILFHGAEVDAADNYGRTPLHMAARYGRTETVRMLLDCGADPSRINEDLWLRVANEEKRNELFGSYNLIWGLLERVLNAGPETSGSADPAEGQVENHLSMTQTGSSRDGNADAGVLDHNSETQSSQATSPEPRSLSQTSSRLHPGSLGDYYFSEEAAVRLAANYGPEEVAAALRVMRNKAQRAGHSSSHRPVQTLLYTPEYTSWRNWCATLQVESRMQRERNIRESGTAFDIC